MVGTMRPCVILCRGLPRIETARGFTLPELLVVVTVLGILLAIGVPSFQSIIIGQRLKNASFEVYSALVLARSEAISRNAAVTITPTAGDWTNGWTVASGATVIRKQDTYPNITINGPASIAFNAMGRTTAAAAQQIGLTATGTSSSALRCVSVDLSGRPRTKNGTC